MFSRLAALGHAAVLTLALALPNTSAHPAGNAPVPSHAGGVQATSNYRTSITSVEPALPGLTVRTADLAGTLELSYTPSGTTPGATPGNDAVVVLGYEGEPYLRISARGVERNEHSPATYLNQDRYARTPLPADADAKAAPRWVLISTGHTVRWHDHRTHWMDPTPPDAVRAHPDAVNVIFPEWKVPLQVTSGGDATAANASSAPVAPSGPGAPGAPTEVAVTGRLEWLPPPSPTVWIVMVVVGCAVLIGAFVVLANTPRRLRRTLVVCLSLAAIVFFIDSVGYFTSPGIRAAGGVSVLWYCVAPLVALGACGTAWWAATQQKNDATPEHAPVPTLLGVTLAVGAGLVTVVGGIDRVDVWSHSQVASAWSQGWASAAAALCLLVGLSVFVGLVSLVARPLLSSGAPREAPPA